MLRNVTYVFVVAACLLLGFAGVVRFSEQIALADPPCNNLEASKEFCDIGAGNAKCEYWAGMGGVCDSKTGWYSQFDYWGKSGKMDQHMILSATSKTCAEKYTCYTDGKTCLKDLQLPSYPQQINGSADCEKN